MKRTAKIVAALLLIVGPVFIESSCGEMFEHCPDAGRFSITDFNLRTIKDQNIYEDAPPSGNPKSSVFLLTFDSQRAALEHLRSTTAAYADCTPATALEKISELSITSSADLVTTDSTYNAGRDLTSVIKFEYSIESLKNEEIFARDLKFFNSYSVPKSQKHVITFALTLSDGRKFTLQTAELEFLPD